MLLFLVGLYGKKKLTSVIPLPREESTVKTCFMLSVLLGQYCHLSFPPVKAHGVKQSITDEGNYTKRHFNEFLIILLILLADTENGNYEYVSVLIK